MNLVSFADGAVRRCPRGGARAKRLRRSVFWRASSRRQTVPERAAAALDPRTRGLVVVISDFLDPEGIEPGFALLRRFRHDVAAVHVISAEEREPRLPEEVVLVDAEDGSATELDATPRLLEAYRKAFQRHEREVEAYCRKHGWAYVQAPTEIPFEDLTLKLMREQGLLRWFRGRPLR